MSEVLTRTESVFCKAVENSEREPNDRNKGSETSTQALEALPTHLLRTFKMDKFPRGAQLVTYCQVWSNSETKKNVYV